MAATRRRSPAALIDALRAEPARFELFQAVRILERAAARAATGSGDIETGPVGHDFDPRGEALFLRAAADLAFPATEVADQADQKGRPELSVAAMGLIGPIGVLPGHYSDLLLAALRDKNTAFRDFLDIFNHRALSFFARAAGKYRQPLAHEQAGYAETDPISAALYALVGLREATLRRRQSAPDPALLFYAGHFAHRPRSADGLARLLSDYFERTVTIDQFQGRWVTLPEAERSRLGGGGRNSGSYAQLGVSAVVGARVWDVQGSFRVRLGPLDYGQFLGFMPDGSQMAELAALTRTYIGPALSFDVQLTLKAAEVPPLALSTDPGTGPRLGWNTWLATAGIRRDVSDAVFRVEEV